MFGAANVCPCIVPRMVKIGHDSVRSCVHLERNLAECRWGSKVLQAEAVDNVNKYFTLNVLPVEVWQFEDAEAKCSQRTRMATLTCAIPSYIEHEVQVSLRSRVRFPMGSLGFFCCTVALRSTQPLVEIRTRDVFVGRGGW